MTNLVKETAKVFQIKIVMFLKTNELSFSLHNNHNNENKFVNFKIFIPTFNHSSGIER